MFLLMGAIVQPRRSCYRGSYENGQIPKKGRLTFNIIPDIRERLTLKHIQVDLFMAQLLQEHVPFKTCLFRFGIVQDNLGSHLVKRSTQHITQLWNVHTMKTNKTTHEKLQSNKSYNCLVNSKLCSSSKTYHGQFRFSKNTLLTQVEHYSKGFSLFQWVVSIRTPGDHL